MKSTLAAIFMAGTSAFASGTAFAQESVPQDHLQDIVVTAQRREESLQKVPVAVTALTSEALDRYRVTDVQRLSGFAPNLTVSNQGLGSIPVLVIRGIASGVSNNAVDPKVALYLDGVYIGRSTGAIFDLADLERVEVLRGPQGTLFGRNATAGAISLVSAPPTGKFGVKQLLSYGNSDAFRSRTIINFPAIGRLSMKLAYLHDEIAGDVKNLIGGQTIDFSQRYPKFGKMTFANRLGSKNEEAVQASARLDLDDLVVDYHFDWTDSRTTGRGAQILSTIGDSSGALGSTVLALQGPFPLGPGIFYPGTGGITNLGTKRMNAVANATSVEHLTVMGHNLTMTYKPTDSLTLKSITGLRSLNQRPNIYDLAGSGGLKLTAGQLFSIITPGGFGGVFAPGNQPGPNDSFYTLMTARSTKQRQFSEEVQATYTSDLFDVTAGAFYFHERSPATDVLGIFQPVANGVVQVFPDIVLPDGTVIPKSNLDSIFGSGNTLSIARNSSIAGYAQATVHIASQFDITGGVRVTKDKRQTQLISVAGGNGGGLAAGQTYRKSFTRANFTGIATWRPSDEITAYAKIATGYVAGGILGAIPYNPESLTAYEIGVKSQLFDNRLRLNVAAFYEDYKNLQIQEFTNGVQFYNNAGAAKIPGFEVELTAVPVTGLTLSGNIGYAGFKYKKYVNGIPSADGSTSSLVDVSDISRIAFASKWTAQASGQYDLPEFGDGAKPYIRLDARWRSKFYLSSFAPGLTLTSLPLVRAGTPDPVTAAAEAAATQKAYWLVDGRIGVAKLAIGGVTADLSLWGQNLFNTRRVTFGAPVIELVGSYERGRTYGIELNANF